MEAVNSLTPEWLDGINDISFRDAIAINPYFYSGSNLKPYIAKDISLKPVIDSTTIKNMFRINALILDSDTELNRIDLATTGTDTYNVGKAWDIVYVARLITSDIRNVTSNTVFDVSLPVSEIIGNYDSRFTTNNLGGRLVCNIFKDNNKYIRKFNISGQTITLDESITGLDNTYTFELINAYDVLPEGLEQTTGYPVRGYVIKHVKPSEDCYIKFPKYDIPNREVGSSVVIYYRKVNEAQPIFTFQDSIDKYGLFAETISLDFPISQAQLNLITNELEKFKEPLITLELETYRPSYAQRGWNIPVNITNAVFNGNYSVVSKSIEYIYPIGQKENYPFIKQNVKLASYINNLESIIASFKRQAQVKSNLAQNFQNKTIISMKYSITSNEGINNTPVALASTNLTATTFDVNFTAVSSISYQVQIASDSGFTSIVNQFDVTGSFALGSTITETFDFSLYPPTYATYYYRVRATFGGSGSPSSWSNIISLSVPKDYIINSNTLVYLKLQNDLQDQTANNNDFNHVGSAINWQGGIVSGDSYSLKFNGTNQYIESNNTDTTTFTELTLRIAMKFDTGDKTSVTNHTLISKYSSSVGGYPAGAVFNSNYDSINNKLSFTIFDNSSTIVNEKYRTAEANYNLSENTNYSLQFAFKLVDPSNSNNNTFEICVNGIKQTVTVTNFNITNINALFNTAVNFFISTIKNSVGNASNFGKYKVCRVAIDKQFRTEAQALTDYNNLFL